MFLVGRATLHYCSSATAAAAAALAAPSSPSSSSYSCSSPSSSRSAAVLTLSSAGSAAGQASPSSSVFLKSTFTLLKILFQIHSPPDSLSLSSKFSPALCLGPLYHLLGEVVPIDFNQNHHLCTRKICLVLLNNK